jgi:hypothetical protein
MMYYSLHETVYQLKVVHIFQQISDTTELSALVIVSVQWWVCKSG